MKADRPPSVRCNAGLAGARTDRLGIPELSFSTDRSHSPCHHRIASWLLRDERSLSLTVSTDRSMNLSEASIALIHECKILVRSQLTS
jgi:hypothetical protein